MEESDETPPQLRNSSSNEPPSLPGCKGDETEAEADTECGWRRFRPKILAPFAHVWTFIVLYIVFSFTHAVQGTYPIAVLTTLERQFNLPSSLSGFIVTTSLYGYLISVIIVCFFLSKVNKPRLFTCCMLLTSIGAFLYFLPHIVIGTGNDAIDGGQQSLLNDTALPNSGSGAVQLCGDNSGLDGPSSEAERMMRTCSAEERQTADESVSYLMSAVVILSIADLVHGAAGAPSWTVGLAFIDDHTHPELSAKLIGLMYTVRMISPIVSFAMGGYLLSIHTTLKETDLTPKHPQWIGAWWMGFLINAIINFLICLPMSMLPGHLRPIRKSSSTKDSPENGMTVAEKVEQKENGREKEKEEEGKKAANGKEKEKSEEKEEDGMEKENGMGKEQEEQRNKEKAKEREEVVGNEDKNQKEEDETDEAEEKKEEGKTEKKVEDTKTSVVPSTTGDESSNGPLKPIDPFSIDWKEFPKAILRLIRNPIYVLTVFAICSDWSALGFMMFVPKYFEVHFQKTASVASLLGGMIPAIFAAVASYVGGVIAGKIKGIDGGVAGLSRMNFCLILISVLLFVPASLLSCPNILYSGHLASHRLNLTTDCNVNCGCSSDVFDPVCGSDGFLYFSPCHAGCTQLVNATTDHPNDLQGRLVRSEECRCVAEAEGRDKDGGGRVVFAGFCDDSCASLIPYALTLIAIVVVSNLYNSSSTTIVFRCIKEEDKSFAVGLLTLCISFALLPAPLLYGKIFDSSCILTSTTPCTDSKGSSCLLYDRHALRLSFHGLAMGLKSIATILYCVAYVLARRKLSQLMTVQQKRRSIRLIKAINEDTM